MYLLIIVGNDSMHGALVCGNWPIYLHKLYIELWFLSWTYRSKYLVCHKSIQHALEKHASIHDWWLNAGRQSNPKNKTARLSTAQSMMGRNKTRNRINSKSSQNKFKKGINNLFHAVTSRWMMLLFTSWLDGIPNESMAPLTVDQPHGEQLKTL